MVMLACIKDIYYPLSFSVFCHFFCPTAIISVKTAKYVFFIYYNCAIRVSKNRHIMQEIQQIGPCPFFHSTLLSFPLFGTKLMCKCVGIYAQQSAGMLWIFEIWFEVLCKGTHVTVHVLLTYRTLRVRRFCTCLI